MGFVPDSGIGDARFFEYFIRTIQAYLYEEAPSTAQKNINLAILEKILIPFPPLAEMKRIVAKCDRLLSVCDTLEQQLTQRSKNKEALIEVIINKILTKTI